MPEPSAIEVELTRLSSRLLRLGEELTEAAHAIDAAAVALAPVAPIDADADAYFARMLELANA